ncbi:hypothetical protein ACLOJK_023533 [Asimina triloba]
MKWNWLQKMVDRVVAQPDHVTLRTFLAYDEEVVARYSLVRPLTCSNDGVRPVYGGCVDKWLSVLVFDALSQKRLGSDHFHRRSVSLAKEIHLVVAMNLNGSDCQIMVLIGSYDDF